MKDSSQITACVVDHGQYVSVALTLARHYDRVFYCVHAERGCPKIEEGILGDGFAEITKVKSVWDVKNVCDVFVFPDIGFEGEQAELRSQGKAVWGSGDYSEYESNRGLFLRSLKQAGLPVPDYEVVQGITNLRLFLREKEDKYIKVSRWRGDVETTHWRDWRQDNGVLDQWAVTFGPAKEYVTFYVLEPIDTANENGIDTYIVDGRMPSVVLHGSENKDKSFIGTMQKYHTLPEEMRQVADAYMQVLHGYRGPWSCEVRTSEDGDPYFIDSTCRYPSPPHQLQLAMWENFGDIILAGAEGECIDPESSKQFGVQALISIDRDKCEWASVEIPSTIRASVFPMYACELDGVLCFPPGGLGNMVAWLVGTGDTIQEAIGNLQEMKADLPDGVNCEDKSLAELLVQLQDAEKEGQTLNGAEIPDPSTVEV